MINLDIYWNLLGVVIAIVILHSVFKALRARKDWSFIKSVRDSGSDRDRSAYKLAWVVLGKANNKMIQQLFLTVLLFGLALCIDKRFLSASSYSNESLMLIALSSVFFPLLLLLNSFFAGRQDREAAAIAKALMNKHPDMHIVSDLGIKDIVRARALGALPNDM